MFSQIQYTQHHVGSIQLCMQPKGEDIHKAAEVVQITSIPVIIPWLVQSHDIQNENTSRWTKEEDYSPSMKNIATQPSVRIRYQNPHFYRNAIVNPLPHKEIILYHLLFSNRTTSYFNLPQIRSQPILHHPLQYENDRNTRLSKAPRKHHFIIISPTTPNKPL